MSGVTKKLISASGGVAGGFTAIEDVFSTYLHTGNGSTQTITNGIDLAGEGGLVWFKGRSAGVPNALFDTERGVQNYIMTNSALGELTAFDSLVSFNSNGFGLGADTVSGAVNWSNFPFASWTFRKAPRFFDVVTYTGTGSAQTIAHNLGTTVGSMLIKRTDSGGSWVVYHRGLNGGTNAEQYFIFLNATTAQEQSTVVWNDTAPTDSVFTVGTNVSTLNASGGTYVAYLFAHDPLGPSGDGSDGLIDCGSYTGTGAAGQIATLGWEPQWVMIKAANTATGWHIYDNMRGMTTLSDGTARLFANNNGAESILGGASSVFPTATGFGAGGGISGVNQAGGEYIYIAIRRGPMRAPDSGTEVFAPAVQGVSGANPTYPTGFVTDFSLTTQLFVADKKVMTRLLGATELVASDTSPEGPYINAVWDYMNGWGNETNQTDKYSWGFRRAPEFFDVVAYTGNSTAGRTVPHNLGVAPEMIIIKRRDGDDSNPHWYVYHAATGTGKMLHLNLSDAAAINPVFWETPSTDEVFDADRNTSGQTYIAYLFATLAGISKVGSYTGNGSSQTINCGFTTGARLVLIKATSTTGDWMIADTARGIVAGNDPYLELNTTNAEVTSEDWLDPDSSGFVVNEVAGSNANTSGVSYIFYAVA